VSCIYGLGDPQSYLKMVLHIDRGDRLDQRELLRRLTGLQYTRNDMDFARATFRVRGDVIDVFPAESDLEAVRIELFDDEVESLSAFDPLTGEVIRKLPRFTFYPKSHYVTPRETLLEAIEKIKDELRQRLDYLRSQNKLVEAQRLEQRTRFDLEMIMELGYCNGIENYSRVLDGRPAGSTPHTLVEYFPEDFVLFIDESHQTIPQLNGMHAGDRSRKETLVEYGFRLPSALDNRPLRFAEFEKLIKQGVFVSATPGPYELRHSKQIVDLLIRPTGLVDPEVEVRPTMGQIDDLIGEIRKRSERGERVLVTTLTKKMAEDLSAYLLDLGLKVTYLHSEIKTLERTEILRDLRLGVHDVIVGINLLREGLDLPEVSLVAILDADKEGFLRSETSLIQTTGRAARHVSGKVIMYADNVTDSMRRAIDETNRRRGVQVAYNEEHGITPLSIVKAIRESLLGREAEEVDFEKLKRSGGTLSLDDLLSSIAEMERDMKKAAKDLDFERAASLRDEIAGLRKFLPDAKRM